MRVPAMRVVSLAALALLLPACGNGGGGTLTPTVAPGIPADVRLREGNRSVTLSWSTGAAGADYIVLRSLTSQGPFFPVSIPSQFRSPTTYVDRNLVNGTTYYYQVLAANSFGKSVPSEIVSGVPGFKAKIVAGGKFAYDNLAILQDGTLWEWGQNPAGLVNDAPVLVQEPSEATDVSCGLDHNLALASNGTVWAWGNDQEGQIGDGGPLNVTAPAPVRVSVLDDAVAVAAGYRFSLALRHDGTVWVWGTNAQGQHGLGTAGSAGTSTPRQVPGLSGIIGITAGFYHALALRNDGLVFIWGDNSFGQLGNGSTSVNPYAPASVSNLNGVVAIEAGSLHSLALRSDGRIWGWGDNSSGQLGLGSAGPSPVTVPSLCPSLSGVRSVGSGGGHGLAVKSDGSVWAWGNDNQGEMGNGTASVSPVATPVKVFGITNISRVAGSGMSCVAVGADGTVWTWGDNSNGQLGNGTGTIVGIPVQLKNTTGIVAVGAGNVTSLAVRSNGTVMGWGADGVGQLGNGTTSGDQNPDPVQAVTISTATAVAAGEDFSLALLSSGTVLAFGTNGHGELGNGTTSFSAFPTPTAVSGLTSATAIACGRTHCLAILGDRTVRSWGENVYFQLGIGTFAGPVTTPSAVWGMTEAVGIAAGERHSIALRSDGTAWVWGDGYSGQLGQGNLVTSDAVATPVPGISGAVAVAAGFFHCLALLGDGTVLAWGEGKFGQLGNGATAKSFVPVVVQGLTGVTAISAGANHSLALRRDGTVWAWGDNGSGQLGNPIATSSSTPIQVQELSEVTSIASGHYHNLACLQNQTVWCWGKNIFGQIGVPNLNQSLTPVVISR